MALIIFPVFLSLAQIAFASDRKTALTLSHYIMAMMYDRMGEQERAVVEYQAALHSDYENPLIHIGLAASFIKKNDIVKAVEELKLAVKFNPEAVEPHAVLALLYTVQNKTEAANREYELALQNASKLEPKNVEIYKTLGIVYLQQKKLADAEKTFKLVLDLDAKDAQSHFYLANIYDQLKKKDALEFHLKKAIELKPDYSEALNYLGYLYANENRDLDKAEKLIREALKIEPDNGAYVDSLGWWYFRKGRVDEALKEIERASLLLEDPVIFDHLGDLYLRTGEKDKAMANWKKSLNLDPSQAEVQRKIGITKK